MGLPSDRRLIVKSISVTNPQSRAEMMQDKYLKIKAGLIVAREFAPTWLMRADADDLISRRLVRFVEQQSIASAWYAEEGWLHKYGSRWVVKRRAFHTLCGTSCITHVDRNELPDSMDDPNEEYYLLNQGHHQIVEYVRSRGVPTLPVPFPATIYTTNSGENCSGQWSISRRHLPGLTLDTRLITRSFRDEFGI
jgi:hypothetical protein